MKNIARFTRNETAFAGLAPVVCISSKTLSTPFHFELPSPNQATTPSSRSDFSHSSAINCAIISKTWGGNSGE